MPLHRQQGLGLAELLVALALLAALAALALPAYRGLVDDARTSALRSGVRAIALMQAERLAVRGAFAEGVCQAGGPCNLASPARLGWRPATPQISYQVVCTVAGARPGECARDADGAGPSTAPSGYAVTATHAAAPDSPLVARYNAANQPL